MSAADASLFAGGWFDCDHVALLPWPLVFGPETLGVANH
jgi:hypothetical protein